MKEPKAKNQIITLRMSPEILKMIETIREKIQVQRGSGASEVARSEVIQILVELGAKHFKGK